MKSSQQWCTVRSCWRLWHTKIVSIWLWLAQVNYYEIIRTRGAVDVWGTHTHEW